MATHSSSLAWKIPWTEEPSRLQSMGSLRVGHDWATSLSLFTFIHWRTKWQPTPMFLPWESQGQGKPGGLPSMGSHRVGHNWNDLAAAAAEQNNFQINSTKLPGVYTMLSSQYPHFQTTKVLHVAPENAHSWPPPLATWSKSLLFFSVVSTIVTAKTWIKRFIQVCDQKYFPGKSGHEWAAPMSKLRVDLLSSLSLSQKKKEGLPSQSSDWDSLLPMQGTRVQSPVRELDPTCCNYS